MKEFMGNKKLPPKIKQVDICMILEGPEDVGFRRKVSWVAFEVSTMRRNL